MVSGISSTRRKTLRGRLHLFGWPNEAAAADGLGTSADRVHRWRTGAAHVAFADYLTLTSMIAVTAAEATKGDDARSADLLAAARELGFTLR